MTGETPKVHSDKRKPREEREKLDEKEEIGSSRSSVISYIYKGIHDHNHIYIGRNAQNLKKLALRISSSTLSL